MAHTHRRGGCAGVVEDRRWWCFGRWQRRGGAVAPPAGQGWTGGGPMTGGGEEVFELRRAVWKAVVECGWAARR
jgi:hypothetical protein